MNLGAAAPWLAAALAAIVAMTVVSGQLVPMAVFLGAPVLVFFFLQPLAALAAMLAFVPIEGFASLVPGSFTLPRLLGLVAFACFAGNMLMRGRQLKVDAGAKMFFAFIAWGFASSFWAADREAAYSLVFILLQLALFYVLCLNLLESPLAMRIALGSYIAGCAVSSLWAMRNFDSHAFATRQLQRVSSVEDMNPNDFGRMVGFGLLANLFLLLDAPTRWMRYAAWAAFPPLLIGLVLSKGRGAWMAFAVALLVLFWRLPKSRGTYYAAGALFGVFALTAVAGFELGYFDKSLEDRFSETMGRDPTAQRTDIWKVGLHLVFANPIAGVGFNNFPVRFNDYMHGVETDVFPGFNKDPHNVFLAAAGETGLIGFSLFIGIFIILYRALARAPNTVSVAMACAFLAFTLVAGLSGTDYIRKWFWFSLAASQLLAVRSSHAHIDA